METLINLFLNPQVLLLAVFVNVLTYIIKSFSESLKDDIPTYLWKPIWISVPFIFGYIVGYLLEKEIWFSLTASSMSVIIYTIGLKTIIKNLSERFLK